MPGRVLALSLAAFSFVIGIPEERLAAMLGPSGPAIAHALEVGAAVLAALALVALVARVAFRLGKERGTMPTPRAARYECDLVGSLDEVRAINAREQEVWPDNAWSSDEAEAFFLRNPNIYVALRDTRKNEIAG